ncbi:flagellin [uncultured Sphingomonas sp.]|uniref:flagellin N-terminal helical domain-containing protein n=1 Tax=uncultured Sphingomonas sp. TaxID=158754 RepID=UPI0035C9CAED
MTPLGTNLFYDRSAARMDALSTRADTLQAQVATGKRLAATADDPVAWRELQGIARDTADDAAYATNTKLAQATLSQAGSSLASIGSQLQRARELAIQANSGTLSNDNLKVIAGQLDEIVADMVSAANARDARGTAIFTGGEGDAVTRNPDGSFAFAATAPATIPVGTGSSVQPGESAARIFTADGGDILSTITALAAMLRTANPDGDAIGAAADKIGIADEQVTALQASVGARGARLDLLQSTTANVATDREARRSSLEDTDVTAAITELQKTMTILQATQASFTKLTGLSLFNYLR